MTTIMLGLAILGALAAIDLSQRSPQAADSATRDRTAMTQESVARLSPAELREWMQQHPGAVVLDVRTPSEFAQGHLAGALNIDIQAPDFSDRVDALDRGVPYMVYCRSGARSERAGNEMLQIGHGPVVNGGGFESLARAGFEASAGR